jgi:hypothetical protein
MSVVIIAMDRYLLICHGYFTSWSKTGILVVVAWFISLVLPALIIFPTLPNSIILAISIVCYPDFSSKDPLLKGLLASGLILMYAAFLILVFCYSNVFFKYQNLLRRREGGQELSQMQTMTISPKSKLLLKKLVIIAANFFFTFFPLVILFSFMLVNETQMPDLFVNLAMITFEFGLFLNPILLYLLDANLKTSVNNMLGIKKPSPIKEKQKKPQSKLLQIENIQLGSPSRGNAPTLILSPETPSRGYAPTLILSPETVQLPR